MVFSDGVEEYEQELSNWWDYWYNKLLETNKFSSCCDRAGLLKNDRERLQKVIKSGLRWRVADLYNLSKILNICFPDNNFNFKPSSVLCEIETTIKKKRIP